MRRTAQQLAPRWASTSDGKVYTVTGDLAANNNAKLVPHLSHKVELTGDVTEKGSTMTIAATNLKMISK
jgi:hypothetical protein